LNAALASYFGNQNSNRSGITTPLRESCRRTPVLTAGEQGEMMSEDIFVEDWRGAKPQPRAGHVDRVSIAVHWLTVVLVATQFATAWLLNLSGSDTSRICSFTAQLES
jgi:hypothetical protein